MNDPHDTQTLSRLLEVDEACLRFEDEWKASHRPRIEQYLDAVTSEARGELLGELLLLEWSYRAEGQDSFYPEEYARRFGSWAPVVNEAWQMWKGSEPHQRITAPPGSNVAGVRPALVQGFEQVEAIGKGGMGEVFRAHDPRLKRWVALKKIRLDQVSPARLARFRTEAEALARLRHPHIVSIHEYQEEAGQPVLVMEYVSGGTLEKRLREHGSLPAEDAARLVAILAWAVQAAHTQNIVHRDLKPDNVLMDAVVEGSPDNVLGGFARVTDFGLAALGVSQDEGRQTVDGEVFGTPAYMAPEQAAGKTSEIGPATDIWALGVILYRCLTGRLPFKGNSVLDTLERVRTMQFRPPREERPDLPAELEVLCLACLSRSPADRPTAKQLAEGLEAFAEGRGRTVTYQGHRPGRPWWPWLVVGAVAASVLLLLVLAKWGKPEQGNPVTPHSLRVRFDVSIFDPARGIDERQGALGNEVVAAWIGQRVVVRAQLSGPAYCYLIGFNFDGKEQLLWPCDADSALGLEDREPSRIRELLYPPPSPAGPGKPTEPRGIVLDDDMRGGMQAFVVVASRQPLPAYRSWRRERGQGPWSKLPAAPGVWRSSGETLDPVKPGEGRMRGSIAVLKGQPPLMGLCGWAAGKDSVVEAIAFPVRGREDR